jgi:hypothetical protein
MLPTILGVPGPLLYSWIGLIKPKLPTHKKYFTTALSSSCRALQEEEPTQQEVQENLTHYTQENFTHYAQEKFHITAKKLFIATLNCVPT